MKIFNWNTEFVSPRAKAGKFEKLRELVVAQDADIVCLTEAYPEAMPDGYTPIKSEISGSVNAERGGARKVVLWSRTGWADVDTIGSPALPEGRFVSSMTRDCSGLEWTFVGMCIPYFGYRIRKKYWGEDTLRPWQGAETYLDALRSDVLPKDCYGRRTVLLGDFNLQIPPGRKSRQTKAVREKAAATFAGWSIPTAGEWDDPALDKRFIDHIALTLDIRVQSMRFVSRFAEDRTRLSDHNGVRIDIVPA